MKFGLEPKFSVLVQHLILFDSNLPIWACPDFMGGSSKFVKPNPRKKRALVRENRRFDPLGLAQNSGGPTKNFRVGTGCPISLLLTMKELTNFDDVRLKNCEKCQGRLHQMMEFE